MILTIKEAATLLNKLVRYTPDEKVELKFLEGEAVVARPKNPNNILFAELVPSDPSRQPMADEHFRIH